MNYRQPTMKAYLIDPLQRAISQIDFDPASTPIVRLLNLNEEFCVDLFFWKKDHQIFSSLQGHAEKRHAFWINGYRWSLAGEALITGPSLFEPVIRRGFIKASDCILTHEEIEREIQWFGLSVIRPSWRNWLDWDEPRQVYGQEFLKPTAPPVLRPE